MGFNIGGATIESLASGVVLNSTLRFTNLGYGIMYIPTGPGYSGWKGGGSTYYSGVSGWELNSANWQNNLNLANGVLTCPTSGYYAMGYNGIHRGGGNIPVGFNTYGYSGFAKNGSLVYFVHWHMSATNAWNTGGTSIIISCAAGDTLALFVNRSPSPTAPDSQSQNYGLYPDAHHAVWCKQVAGW